MEIELFNEDSQMQMRAASGAGLSAASLSAASLQRATLHAVLSSSPCWLEALAADVQAPLPESPEDLLSVIQTALERKVINPVPLRRAPHIDENLDQALRRVFWEEHISANDVPAANHVGRTAVDACAADVRDMMAYLGGCSDATARGSSGSSSGGSRSRGTPFEGRPTGGWTGTGGLSPAFHGHGGIC
jgi:hypothetical protein